MPKLKEKDERHRILEAVLYWEGEISNTRVRSLFGVQPVQASRLLTEFRESHPPLALDTRRKVWSLQSRQGLELVPLDEYARHVTAGTSQVVDGRASLCDPSPDVFSAIRRAAAEGLGVEILYASMSTPKAARRTIFPHTLVHVGRRWHARAWCANREEFRDFTLGRIRQAELLADLPSSHRQASDRLWTISVEIEFSAHSELPAAQQRVIEAEYFGGRSGKAINVRACLLQYVIQDLRAAVRPKKEKPPEYQLEVRNTDALKDYLFSAS